MASTNKRTQNEDEEKVGLELSPPKKPRTGCWGEPDVIVVVGDQEFQHACHLCCWSGYFHAALSVEGRWKESQTKRFEFPHRKPEEWETLTSILAQFATTKISQANVFSVISWSSELIIPNAMAECDKYLAEEVVDGIRWNRWLDVPERVQELLEIMETTSQYSGNLPLTRAKSLAKIANGAKCWTVDQLKTILKLAEEHEDCKEQFHTSYVLLDALSRYWQEDHFAKVCVLLPVAAEHNNLKKVKKRCVEIIQTVFEEHPDALTIDRIGEICKVMAEHKDLREELWKIFDVEVSAGLVPAEEEEDSQCSGWQRSFHISALVHLSLQRKMEKRDAEKRELELKAKLKERKREVADWKEKAEEANEEMDRVKDIIRDAHGCTNVSTLKQRFLDHGLNGWSDKPARGYS